MGQHNGNARSYFSSGTLPLSVSKKHGKEVFKKEIIVQGNFNKKLLNELEKHYIRLFGSFRNGMNFTSGGGSMFVKQHKEIFMYSMSGKFKRNFRSAEEASLLLGIGISGIRKCLNGKSKSSGGFRWSYTKHGDLGPYVLDTDFNVYKFDSLGNLQYTWKSLRDIKNSKGKIYYSRVIAAILRKGSYDNSYWSKEPFLRLLKELVIA